MAGIDYRTPKATWTQKPNGQWRVQIRVKVPTAIDAEGRTIYTPKRISKQFSPEDSKSMTTDAKRRNALNNWIASLEQADADAAAERERMEAEAEAERIAAEQRAEAERIAAEEAATPTVDEYVTSYIDTLEASGNVERVTAYNYRITAARIAEGFPNVKIIDLTTAQVQKWENGLSRKGYSPATVLKYHRLLSEVCKHAADVDQIIARNPCAGVKVPKQKAPSPNSLTREGYARLARTLELLEPSAVVTAATIALYTGLRQGEICGLRWRNYRVDGNGNHTIKVEEAIGKAKGGTYSKAPKTKSSQRTVPVPEPLADMLERRRAHMVKELELDGISLDQNDFDALYIVGYSDGQYHSPTLLSRNWKALSSSFGLVGTQGRRISFHDLRHSFASLAISEGADIKAVAAVLGHANAAITLNVYADAYEEGKRRASELIERAVREQGDVIPYAELAEQN